MSDPTLNPDQIVERRRMRRRLSFWRLATLVAVGAALVVVGSKARMGLKLPLASPQIARIAITGLITGDDATIKLIDDAAKSKAVRAIILRIDSPGGTTAGSERLYVHLRAAAKAKPVVAEVETMAASGAYVAAIGADHIVVRGNSLVGSIGVLFEYPNFYKLMNNVGIAYETIKSSPLKASPNGMEPTSDAARAALAAVVADSFTWFKGLVQTRRKMSDAELAVVDDGRIFTGRQGVTLKLADEIGGETQARLWLQKKGVAESVPVVWHQPPASFPHLGVFGVLARIAQLSGFPKLGQALAAIPATTTASSLDGLMSFWQISAAK
ncbi:MAG: signal peptide peptidase SppA [Hyphomicrobiales bacterium]|nr:signal peptide peptidase SppA [Hyphomicrobiales bacterium]